MAEAVARVRDPNRVHRQGQRSTHAQGQGYGHVFSWNGISRTFMGVWTSRNRFVLLPRQDVALTYIDERRQMVCSLLGGFGGAQLVTDEPSSTERRAARRDDDEEDGSNEEDEEEEIEDDAVWRRCDVFFELRSRIGEEESMKKTNRRIGESANRRIGEEDSGFVPVLSANRRRRRTRHEDEEEELADVVGIEELADVVGIEELARMWWPLKNSRMCGRH
ncbi:hypothetical protein Syun_018225 [Stephania yunnanensis]|uniref:Uncharacterized protein n=1 Tax=Stephania yunnanensis TaxID=152371 RepID=A0AAP0NVL9_9MAGN